MVSERKQKRLEAIRKNRACKKLSNEATKQDLLDAHRVKMQAKKIVRANTHTKFKEDFENYKAWKLSMIQTKRAHVL